MADCVVRSRIDRHIKIAAAQLFAHMGLTLSEAVRLFLYQTIAEKRLPFEISAPNAITREALESTKSGKHLEKTSLNQLKKDWNEACVK